MSQDTSYILAAIRDLQDVEEHREAIGAELRVRPRSLRLPGC